MARGDAHAADRIPRACGRTASVRWCIGTAAASVDAAGRVVRISGVTIDITDRKEAEERQELLAREVDHRARNALAVVQSIVRLTRAKSVEDYVAAVEGRIKALARAHALLSDVALARRRSGRAGRRRNWRRIGQAKSTRSKSAGRTSRCSRTWRRVWRWRCTNSPPTPPSMARCRRWSARST